MSVLQISGADKYYNKGKSNEVHVINGVSLALPETGMVAIFGKSGCGKTTLLNALGGLDKIDRGTVSIMGKDLRENTDELRNRYVGYIFQNYNLNQNETVYENVADALRLCGMTDEATIKERVTTALSNVGMAKYRDRLPDTLSGGQQQRVAIARALVKSPAVILADEPTGNLDEANTVKIMDILKEVSQKSLVLLVTHEADLVDFYCDRVVEIVDGSVRNDYENEQTNGYVQKDKNDIYLGELKEEKHELPGVKLSYFGDVQKEIQLRIISVGGKLYLKNDTPDLRILDENSEIRLKPGVFENHGRTAKNGEGTSLQFAPLEPFEGKRFGKLFGFRNALSLAWREVFATRQKKKGKKLLRIAMFLLSVVLVFLSATAGINVKSYVSVREDYDPNLFYLPLDKSKDYSALTDHIGEHGIDYARVLGYSTEPSDALEFRSTPFMTASAPTLTASGNLLDAKLTTDMKLLAGTKELKESGDIVITSALAKDLFESSTVSYYETYEDLVGIRSTSAYFNSSKLRIVGVVESNEKSFYADGLSVASAVVQNCVGGYCIYPASSPAAQNVYSQPIERGSVACFGFYDDPYFQTKIEKGATVKILGKNFEVAEAVAESEKFYGVIVNDEDYLSFVSSVGESTDRFGIYAFEVWDYSWGNSTQLEYRNYMLIHANDPSEADAYLTEAFGEDLIRPDDILAENVKEAKTEITTGFVSIGVTLLLLCLCIFFIMRASFMNRVREVGILRAIGVSKRNLIFRFTVEALLLTLSTTLLGYLISWWFISSLSKTMLFSLVFYFPAWLAVGILVLLCAVAVGFGILPAVALLHKTPSEILSKYDI